MLYGIFDTYKIICNADVGFKAYSKINTYECITYLKILSS